MADDRLQEAYDIAEKVRFSLDSLKSGGEGSTCKTDYLRSFFAQSDLLISNAVTPAISSGLTHVYDRLHIPPDAIQAFVYASPEVQAECFASSTKTCIIRFSSAIVDLLDQNEIAFVAGHEIGHFLLGHGLANEQHRQQSLEFFMQQRCQEISVDRVGLLACGSLAVAVRTLMKTASGLSDKHLRFDVGTFLSQLRHVDIEGGIHGLSASHPSILVRCRALLWFSLSDFFKKSERHYSRDQMEKLDELVERDLAKYVDGPARRRIAEAKENLALWMAAYKIVQGGVFAKREQKIFEGLFGEPTLSRLKNFLRNMDSSAIDEEVFLRVQTAREELEVLIPMSFQTEISKLEEQISKNFR